MISFRKLQRMCAAGLALFYLCCCVTAAAVLAGALWPEASGKNTKKNGSLTVDFSHADDGYIMARASSSKKKLKLRITRGDSVFTYDLNQNGEYEVFPLQLGSGSYKCSLYKNVSGKKYTSEGSVSFKASMADPNSAYLYPNQYVNYTPDCPAVALSYEICEGLTNDMDKARAIRDYLKANFLYDYVKATTVPAGSMPDIEGCMENRMGICQDLTALAACMLRVQGIPTKMVIGYADRNYHAWNSVLLDGKYRLLDMTAELKGISSDVTYTEERCY